MKSLLLPIAMLAIFNYSTAQCGDRYRNFMFDEFVKTSDINYGHNINMDGADEQLMMDVYVPEGDVETNRAVIIICHGGFFLAGDKAAIDVVPMCEDFAKMGYVVASINYRLGVPLTPPLNAPYSQAVARAVQDLRAAIRWFRKDADLGGNQYGIDPAQIYVGGDSAGGFMALHLAFLDEEEIPSFMDMSIAGLEGGLEGESGNPGYSSEVGGIFSVSGALGDSSWVDINDTIPVCLFHGTADNTVTFNSDMFVLFGLVDVTEIDGSNSIHQKLDELSLEHCFEINEGSGHVPYQSGAAIYDTTISIISNFLSHYICGADWDCSYREITTGISELDTQEITIYPNPTSHSFRIVADKHLDINYCQLLDASGRIVKNIALKGTADIDISDLGAGFYCVKLTGDDWQKIIRLVVE